jgi:L-ascorbate metabolism protein UlaG (beta-lactamase superfamily)
MTEVQSDQPAFEPPGSGSPTKVTYLGHASLLIEHDGTSIVTDPVFTDRIGRVFTKRMGPSSFRPEELSGVVGVLISHAHHDHLDYRSLRRVGRAQPVVVPWGSDGRCDGAALRMFGSRGWGRR